MEASVCSRKMSVFVGMTRVGNLHKASSRYANSSSSCGDQWVFSGADFVLAAVSLTEFCANSGTNFL